ncbi:MAG TPA: mycofactocin biosynthesis peptidyl-dipeptidase MftE [Acidimicrobiales bacterium]|nr:mycofactocin biosynthesis peptidyl-dipeptidase MftE [Acidimicrobiales bacterium]
MRLSASAWPDLAVSARTGGVLVIPLGSTEQHGPHLPVTTDTDIAVAVVVGAAVIEARLAVAPPVAYGASGEHQGFAGTLSIGQDATELVLLELGRSAAAEFTHVLVVSAHGGNAAPLSRAMALLSGEGHPVTAWSPSWPGDAHAGRTETSLMMAIAPHRVHLDRAEPGDRRPLGTLLPQLQRHGVRSVSSNGILGDPSGANADEGARLLGEAVEALLAVVASLPSTPPREVRA